MSSTFIETIQKRAESISARMNHYYLGVEHLFMALVDQESGQTASALKRSGLPPAFVRYALELSLGQSLDKRYWRGFRTTPRYEKVLTLAQDLEGQQDGERALLLGILSEGQSLPVRQLQALGVDIERLRAVVQEATQDAAPAATDVESSLPILAVEKALLGDFFAHADGLHIAQDLSARAGSAYSRMYVVQQADGEDAHLVRFDSIHAVLQEKRRYDDYFHIEPPIAVDQIAISDNPPLAATRYKSTLQPQSLRAFDSALTISAMDGLPQRIYERHVEWFWAARERYQIDMWREYEADLPPALVIDIGNARDGDVIRPLEGWSRDRILFPDAAVTLRDFTVREVQPQSGNLILAAGPDDEAVNGASQVCVIGLDAKELEGYFPGQHIDALSGRVRRTRQDLLLEHTAYIRPNFDPDQNTIETPVGTLPNPLTHVPLLLQHPCESYLTLIHGSMHGDCVLLDPDDEPGLVDFSRVRVGHALYDWVMLELSIVETNLLPFVETGWGSVWPAMRHLESHVAGGTQLVAPEDMAAVFNAMTDIREVADFLLGQTNDWREYHAARALMAIARLGHTSTPLAARRMLFATAAFATEAFLHAG